ncbi:MAG: demethylmenaquinone methyltransferase / 2-methoxy-6-polyprenyl,4-benzoquinol methylase [Acidobacteriota bacterium]|jgi:demethylmenaquinone methyltransferase/2-methoxy-6-polyprenyl-1,4-benzoquinol methylase|nr:demethylmenaquinone methyltransferase / 2-methoxy-6-polyprenyl,4-benzoquinol methylase [Acidobacteriota bacterium]
MFAAIATRYDLLNHLLSGNVDKRWRRLVVAELRSELTSEGARALDVACGTGDLALAMGESAKASVVGIDFCRPMLQIAARKASANLSEIRFVEGDALGLPFRDQSFDVATIAFGLRNLSTPESGLSELLRVLKPGGRAAILEFSKPVIPGFRTLFQFYFSHVLPKLGRAISGSRDAYSYLPESVSRFPDQKRLARLMRDVGFVEIDYRNLTGGIAALHIGARPSL